MSIFARYGHKFFAMNVSFTEKQERYIKDQIESGDFQNASEVVRDALRMHEIMRQRILEDLRKEINRAWDAPLSKRSAEQILADKKAQNGYVG
ncbi:MAG: type II toxin-antitoxin system ParD family antitoxin [Cyclobacteriaceae bacterium]